MTKVTWMFRALFYKVIMKKFGLLSYIGRPCYISGLNNCKFGSKVRIYPGARIESLGGDINIGNDVSIGQNLHIISTNMVVIGSRSTLSANIFISDVDHKYEEIDVHIMAQGLDTKTTTIGDNCFIGYGSVIMPGTVLGSQCVIGANSVVRGVFPPLCVIAGTPAKIIKRYDSKSSAWLKTDTCGNFI